MPAYPPGPGQEHPWREGGMTAMRYAFQACGAGGMQGHSPLPLVNAGVAEAGCGCITWDLYSVCCTLPVGL